MAKRAVPPGHTPSPPQDLRAARALARNDVYLQQVVEAHKLCPFARPCRESGQLKRVVLQGPAFATELREAVGELQLSVDGDFEVALVIAPGYRDGPAGWERLVRQTADGIEAGLERQGQRPACYVVAFHPDMPYGTAAPHQLVGLLRHSPDPTAQLVRRTVLDSVRGDQPEQRFVDLAEYASLREAVAAVNARAAVVSLSDRIAAANYAHHAEMRGQLERLLAAVRDYEP